MIPILDLKREYGVLEREIQKSLGDVLRKGIFILGENVVSFEKEFAQYCGAKYGVGMNSGTDALFLGLLSLGVGPGDEVIVPTFTYIASVLAISFTGAKPVLVDIDSETFNIDIQKMEDYLKNNRVKAVMPVHLFGQPVDMDPIVKLAKKYNIKIIEDSAQAHGAEYKNKKVGSLGDVGCFSFYPTKNLGAYGDGGMVVTNDERTYKKLRFLRDYGRTSRYEHEMKGYNSRLDEIQAAILRIKLKYLDEWNNNRRQNAKLYNELLKDTGVITPVEKSYAKHVYHQYVIKTEHRDKLQKYLTEKDIASLIHYPIPVHLQKAYKELNLGEGSFPVAEKCSNEVLSLPVFPQLEKSEIEIVCKAIKDAISR